MGVWPRLRLETAKVLAEECGTFTVQYVCKMQGKRQNVVFVVSHQIVVMIYLLGGPQGSSPFLGPLVRLHPGTGFFMHSVKLSRCLSTAGSLTILCFVASSLCVSLFSKIVYTSSKKKILKLGTTYFTRTVLVLPYNYCALYLVYTPLF
jgi:hypothetical protein